MPQLHLVHDTSFQGKLKFFKGTSKVCTKGCKLNRIPIHQAVCKHSDKVRSVLVSKVVSDRSIHMVENLPLGVLTLGIQYDTGCQLSLISKSALETIPTSMYSQGTSSRVRVMTYAGEGKVILTTEVKLRLNGKMLKFSAIEEDLNNGSEFSFPTPSKWKTFTRTSNSSH